MSRKVPWLSSDIFVLREEGIILGKVLAEAQFLTLPAASNLCHAWIYRHTIQVTLVFWPYPPYAF